jgi:proline iminopeptidase
LQDIENNNDFDNPKYSELLFKYYYTEHVLRMPLRNGQNPITAVSSTLIQCVFICKAGIVFGITGNATLKKLGCQSQIKTLTVPTLSIGSKYDTMDPNT